jgi:hypothetical protein
MPQFLLNVGEHLVQNMVYIQCTQARSMCVLTARAIYSTRTAGAAVQEQRGNHDTQRRSVGRVVLLPGAPLLLSV